MMTILAITLPVFLVVALGFGVARVGLLEVPGGNTAAVLNKFVLNVALPVTLFYVVSQVEIAELNLPWFILAYATGGILTWLLMILVTGGLMGKTRNLALLSAMGGTMPNNLFFGFPLLVQLFGSAPANAFTTAVVVENLLIFAPLLLLLQIGGKADGESVPQVAARVLVQVFRSPIMVAILLGLCWAALPMPRIEAFFGGLALLADASAGVALFTIGYSLAKSRLTLRADLPLISTVVVSKLIVHPLLVLTLILLLPDFDPRAQVTAVLIAAVPMASVYPLLGARYDHERECLSGMMVTVLVAFFTVTAWIAILDKLILHGM